MLLTSAIACGLFQLIATASGCKTTTSAVMVHCLRQKTENELLEIALNLVHVSVPVASILSPWTYPPSILLFLPWINSKSTISQLSDTVSASSSKLGSLFLIIKHIKCQKVV